MMRLLRGVKGKELIQWASYSPTRTKLLVNLLEEATVPASAISAGVRLTGVVNKDLFSSEAPSGPPPRPSGRFGAGDLTQP